jgi:arylsulfatase A-like enzyme
MPAPRHASESPSLRRYALPHVNEADVSDKPPWIASLHRVEIDRISRQRLSMYRSLQAVDEAVVDILAALKEARRLDDALIVFTSDNGVSSGEHRVPLNNKYLPYAAQSEVPLVLRWDGRIARGVIDRRLAVNVDIAATIADAAGQPPAGIDGRSLLSDRRRNGVVISAARSDGSGLNGIKVARPAYCGLRTRRYVYVLYSSGEEELYDYRRDPYELRNRSGAPAYADVRTSMRSRTLTRCTPRPPGW